ncbi:MAG: N-acetyltransferase [Clostridiales bacterium]|nr:N-acetyltransferase [Clostridiales bacterium]
MIKKLQPEMIDSVMDLWLRANLRAHDFIGAAYWHSHYDMVRGMLPDAEVYVFEEGGAVRGFIGLTGDFIEGIFVDAPYQSKGIGKALLDYAKQNRNALSLRVYKKNVRAATFYLREGFAAVREQVDENTGEEELVMRWTNDEVEI